MRIIFAAAIAFATVTSIIPAQAQTQYMRPVTVSEYVFVNADWPASLKATPQYRNACDIMNGSEQYHACFRYEQDQQLGVLTGLRCYKYNACICCNPGLRTKADQQTDQLNAEIKGNQAAAAAKFFVALIAAEKSGELKAEADEEAGRNTSIVKRERIGIREVDGTKQEYADSSVEYERRVTTREVRARDTAERLDAVSNNLAQSAEQNLQQNEQMFRGGYSIVNTIQSTSPRASQEIYYPRRK